MHPVRQGNVLVNSSCLQAAVTPLRALAALMFRGAICQGDFPGNFVLAGGRILCIGYKALWACLVLSPLTSKYVRWLWAPPMSRLLTLALSIWQPGHSVSFLCTAAFAILLAPSQSPPNPSKSKYGSSSPKLELEFAGVAVLRWDLEAMRSWGEIDALLLDKTSVSGLSCKARLSLQHVSFTPFPDMI